MWSCRTEPRGSGSGSGSPTCGEAGALLRAQTRYRPAARRPGSGPLDLQLPVVTARVSEPGSAHRVDPWGGQSAVVRVHGVRESGQNQRPSSVQQQWLLAVRPSGQNRSRKDAVDAEHPGGHDEVRAQGNGSEPGRRETALRTSEDKVQTGGDMWSGPGRNQLRLNPKRAEPAGTKSKRIRTRTIWIRIFTEWIETSS